MKIDGYAVLNLGFVAAAVVGVVAMVFFPSHPGAQANAPDGAGAAEDAAVASMSLAAEDCASLSDLHEFHKCIDGKTRSDVIAALGQPSDRIMDGDLEKWYYAHGRVSTTDQNGLDVGVVLSFDRADPDDAKVAFVDYH